MKETIALIFNRAEWEAQGIWSSEELNKALDNKGFIGIKSGFDCYMSYPIKTVSSPPDDAGSGW